MAFSGNMFLFCGLFFFLTDPVFYVSVVPCDAFVSTATEGTTELYSVVLSSIPGDDESKHSYGDNNSFDNLQAQQKMRPEPQSSFQTLQTNQVHGSGINSPAGTERDDYSGTTPINRPAPRHRQLKPGKVPTDPKDCFLPDEYNKYGGPPPCRVSDDGSSSYNYTKPRPPPNQMRIDMWVGISPERRAVTPLLTSVVVEEWHTALEESLDFKLPDSYHKIYKQEVLGETLMSENDDNEDSRISSGETMTTINGIGGRNPDGRGNSGSNVRRKLGRTLDRGTSRTEHKKSFIVPNGAQEKPVLTQANERHRVASDLVNDISRSIQTVEKKREKVFDMYYIKSESKVKAKHKLRWWWWFKITFECYWKEDQTGVEKALMEEIHANMTESLQMNRQIIESILKQAKNDPNIRLRTAEEGIPDHNIDDEDKERDDTSKTESTDRPEKPEDMNMTGGDIFIDENNDEIARLDPQEWDWRKFLGLGLLLGTLAFATTIRYLSARRQREREQRQIWGNLRTKDGVEALLNTAWILDGSKMQIYDKTKMGYTDDDSIFLGGFEQKEAMVGAEITVTHPTTETPETTLPSDLPPKTSPSFLSSKKSVR